MTNPRRRVRARQRGNLRGSTHVRLRAGLLARTSRGRVATAAAWAHLGLPMPKTASPPGLFDVDGTVLETPGEPADSTLKDRLYHGAYPTDEHQGVVFAYMGPPDRQPSFPVYDSYSRPGYRLMPGLKYFYPCNWLQIMENTMDPAHTAFLHTIVSGAVFTSELGVLPELDFVETQIGMIYGAMRRVGENGSPRSR